MKRQEIAIICGLASAILVSFTLIPAGAQGGTRRVQKWTAARLPDGQPDMQGTYTSGWSAPIERYSAAEQKEWQQKMLNVRGPDLVAYGSEWMEAGLRKGHFTPPPGTVQVVDPPDGKIPWQPWALEKRNYIRDHPYERREFIDPKVRCLPVGPRLTMLANYNGWQVLQPPLKVVIIQEHNHNYRIIPVDGSVHPGPSVQLWMGDSRGHWEGNTLVVDVANFTDKTWIVGEGGGEGMSAGSFHSTALHMIERFTMVDADNINYEATIEDPNVFTTPWTLRFGVWARAPTDYENYEYACHEGNTSMELIDSVLKKP